MKFPIYRKENAQESGWKTTVRQPLLQHQYIEINEVEVESPGRETPVLWTMAKRRNAIVVAPRLADGRYLLILQQRYPIQRTIWEFPAGMIDAVDKAQDPEVIEGFVHQELREETAHQLTINGMLKPLGYFFSSPGFWDEHAYLFEATEVEPIEEQIALGEEQETILEAKAFSLEELTSMVAQGEIIDANTLALYAKLAAR